ncbi:ribonuclease III [Parabacteroides sp. AD58]|uniref:Ribonuclease 3 n=1 Tax=Parabacteroides absconsus TaxID=2951805 RepID=A0ABZ2IHI9_9BACT|nr:ribonuclease III [Parabacteroides sp. AD58]MCM6902625.1 ribonuclease III [Parabacteroides sp. AD58]
MHKGKEPYLSIYKIVGFYPDNIQLYKQAFLHKSQSIEDDEGKWLNNERLEFLGDAILSAVVADIVYKHFQNKREGFLTNTRSKIVSRDSMNRIGLSLGIDHLLRYSINVHAQHEAHNSNMLGNALEALIGAIYLDQGFDACYRFIDDVLIKKHIDIDKISETEVNFKSNLIEWGQKNRLPISFEIIESFQDEQSNPVFQTAAVLVETGEHIGIGIGYSKKESQQNAAQMAMKKIRTDRIFQQHILGLKKKLREEKKSREEVEQTDGQNIVVEESSSEVERIDLSPISKEAVAE